MPSNEIVTLAEVNQFLPVHKYQIDNIADTYELQLSHMGIIRGTLRNYYDMAAWQDSSSTPRLIKTILSLFVAGRIYTRQFSEESAKARYTYGQQRVEEAYALLQGIIDGVYGLEEAYKLVDSVNLPTSYETEPVFEMQDEY